MQVVLEEGLDRSGLPETLKEDFDELDKLKGQYRVTSFLIEDVDVEDLSPREGPPCFFCNAKRYNDGWAELVENNKTMITLSKVDHRNGMSYIECMESESIGKHNGQCIVLGHTNFIKNAHAGRNINFLSMNKLIVPFSNIFRLGYVDGRTLRQDTWYTWRRKYWEEPRQEIYQQTWKLDKEGNLTSIRQVHFYCAHCKDVKQVIQTLLTERV